MANLQKYTRGALGHMLAHYNRKKDEQGNYINFGNQNIDKTKTYLNYNLHKRNDNLTDFEFIDQYTKSLKVMNRKDINLMCSWVITLPDDLKSASKADQELFFRECYNFNCNRYGKQNVVSANVHLDETTPHMHFAFVPVVFDKKNNRYKVNAKNCVNRADLTTFHSDLSKHMEKVFKRDIGLVNAPDVGKNSPVENRTIAQLKKENSNLAEENQLLSDENMYLESVNLDLLNNNRLKSVEYDELKKINLDLIKTNNKLEQQISDNQAIFKENKNLKLEINGLENYLKTKKFKNGISLFDDYKNKQNKSKSDDFER